ncbi:unnamed protein product [Adineta ricciae]|uniref:Uncharacterized protein n=1 Tax=Adineta ricciae TaxID=249248 RepID=A0A814AEA8_ADIRI|nr:unnamed protein product [Adineta ricciae]CAF0911893.1 unnamed protein product [Adineta ricciae]
MVAEQTWWPWKPSLLTQHRIRIADQLRVAQRQERCNELRRQITLVEEDIAQLLQRIKPIDFAQIDQRLDSCLIKQEHTLKDYSRVEQQLLRLAPKLLLGNAYYRTSVNEIPIRIPPTHTKRRRKRLKLTVEQQWKNGIGDAYRRLQLQRDIELPPKPDPLIPIPTSTEPLPIVNDYLPDEPPIVADNFIDVVQDHEFLPPLPPPPLSEEIIIPFKTPPPPKTCRSPPSDRLQLAVDDTIVKPHRLINKTLGNLSLMSFHVDPDQCSSPKSDERKKKTKLKKLMLPPLPPSAPQFSSTAIFDTHAFFTQSTNKSKKQKRKIDISRQPAVMATDDVPKKKGRTKKSSPYDFQDDDNSTLSRTKGVKLLTDDIITARFAKNSHFQSHQTSVASTKSSKSRSKTSEHEHTKKKKNILGIGTSSPLISSTNLTLSPGRLSTDDKDTDADYTIKSTLSKRHTRTTKSRRTRVK